MTESTPELHSQKQSNDQALGLMFLLALAAVYLVYQLGLSAGWTFDDWFSLNGLQQVVDLESAKTYILGNTTGPTGRPVAMATFLLNIDDWQQQNPAGFRQINVFIHLFNMLLVALAGWQVAVMIPSLRKNAVSFGVLLGLVWGIHPLFVSAVLSAVQRMALLSGCFVLLGINGFLYGRRRMVEKPLLGLVILLVSIGIFSLLAVYSKENGALLPVFVGLLELQILSRYQPFSFPLWRPFWQFMLWGPVLIFLGYVVYSWPSIVNAQDGAYRDFSWSQRLWSEPLILWEYLRQLYVPNILSMGPLQDDISRIHGADLYTLVALAAWIAVLAMAWRWRRKVPVVLFGIGFFLLGHLVESSFIQLELYFEHRNYIPSLGLLVIPLALFQVSRTSWVRLLPWITALPLLGFLLYLTTAAWGNPLVSSSQWYANHPTSLRALQMRLRILKVAESPEAAAAVAAAASDRMPERINVAALALKMQCEAGNEVVGRRMLDRVSRLSREPNPLRGALGFLGFMESVLSQRLDNKCAWISYARLRDILLPFLQDPALLRHKADHSRLLVSLGLIDIATGDVLKGVNRINQGYLMHQSYGLFAVYTRVLRDLGQPQAAEALREAFLSRLPKGITSMEEHRRRVNEAYKGNPE